MENSIQAVAYIYSATNNQDGIRIQREQINEYAVSHKINIIDWIEDTNGSRYGLYKFTLNTPKDVESIIVSEPSRLCRDLQEYQTIVSCLSDNNVKVRTTTNSFDNTYESFMKGLAICLGQYDHEHKSKHVKLGMKRNIENGLYPFRPPLGYVASGTKNLYQPTHAAKVFGEYLHRAANNEISVEALHAIAKKLFITKKPISANKLKQIALNPFYAGVTSFDGQAYQGSHRTIVSIEDQKQLEGLFA